MDLVYLTSPIIAGVQVLGSLAGICKMVYVSYTWTDKIINEKRKSQYLDLNPNPVKFTVKVEAPKVGHSHRTGPRQFVRGHAY